MEAVAREDFSLLGLTERELHILRLAAQGRTNREIALDIDRDIITVKNTLSEAYSKLGARSRTEAYIAMGWLNVPPL